MEYLREIEGKRAHDRRYGTTMKKKTRCECVEGPIIVGAGPSGLAAAACLKESGVPPGVVLERSDCVASLWQHKTYDRLCLHLPKQFCELPFMPFPEDFPTYPTKQQFLEYVRQYADRFDIRPVLNQTVRSAGYDRAAGFWRVVTTATAASRGKEEEGEEAVEYVSRWLIAATGENAEAVVPEIAGMEAFSGTIMHTSLYKEGEVFRDKRVLVIGCGNSGMEVCLDLCNHNAAPSLVVRDTVHVLPREMMGRSTFGLSMWLLKWLPVRIVDRFLLAVSWLTLGDTARLGLPRPPVGPLELKNISGKTPVLDVGTLAKIKTGHIKVYPGIQRLKRHTVEFVNGKEEPFDSIILATGYKSNVPSWLKDQEMFSEKDGLPKRPFPNGWKGECGLYAVGFTKRGLLGASMDAKRIAQDIKRCWSCFLTVESRSKKAAPAQSHRQVKSLSIFPSGITMASVVDKIILIIEDALDKLIGVLKNIFYGRVEFHDGVCIAYDHVDEILKTLHLFRHLLDLPYSDSELYAFNVEISCSIQDLVRGTPMSLSDIPLELKSFKIRMMNAIRNLLGIPIAPPDLVPTTTLHNPTSIDIESMERTVGDSVRDPAVDADGVSVEGTVNAFPSDPVTVDAQVDAPGTGEVAKDPTLSNVIIACSLVPSSKTAQVADANYTQADISLFFNIIKSSAHANIVESEYWVSPPVAKFVFALLSYVHRYTPICRLNEDL
ncbi:unnamed protein product [Cuscuta campestris]|uniref:Flavin-containing monooxygenase n=1 Tax=Cuscuta campestris TaxID=132261 RepID=A0A484N8H8_9ASTE|nr:unnamed protein product [Cuscuta campestris]